MRPKTKVRLGIINVNGKELTSDFESLKHERIVRKLDQLSSFDEKFEWCQSNCKEKFEFVHKVHTDETNKVRIYELFIVFESNEDYLHYLLRWSN